MSLDELKAMTFSEIEHSGVKGMKWGKRKDRSRATSTKEPGRLKKSIASSKREALLLKDLRNTSKMTDDQLKTKTKRIQSENDLKRLTETKGITKGTKKAKAKREIYWDRGKMSDAELKTKVDRLQLEANLKKQIKKSNATHIKAANGLINSASKLAVSQFSDEQGNFSATGDPIYDSIISSVLKQTSKKKMIQQSAIEGNELMIDKQIYDMTLSELQHSGVKGMKWGKRKASYSSAAKKHESKTKARDDSRKEKVASLGTKYMDASKKHEAKTQARTDKRKANLKSAGTKYMDASKKHEAKTVAKRERSKVRVQKAYNGTIKVLNNPKLKKSVDALIIANASYAVTAATIKTLK